MNNVPLRSVSLASKAMKAVSRRPLAVAVYGPPNASSTPSIAEDNTGSASASVSVSSAPVVVAAAVAGCGGMYSARADS